MGFVSFIAALIGLLMTGAATNGVISQATAAEKSARGEVDYLEPEILTGTIYADADAKKALFAFRRTAVESNSTVQVLREYTFPKGSLAARERVVYVAGKLASYQMEELQNGAHASVVVQPAGNSAEQRIVFTYSRGSTKKTGNEKLQPDTLINDMVAPFILAHWDQLMNGSTVKFRMVAASRAETVGFKLVKESETTRHGKPVVIMRMEPANAIIASFINPLRFIMERDGLHHILEYSGRTTPSILRKDKWEDLDAVTVFDWK